MNDIKVTLNGDEVVLGNPVTWWQIVNEYGRDDVVIEYRYRDAYGTVTERDPAHVGDGAEFIVRRRRAA